MDKEIIKIKEMFPDVPEAQLEAAINVAYGYAGNLDRSTLQRNTEISIHEKEATARISHALSHAAIYASSPEASPEEQEAIASYLRLAQNLINNKMLENNTLINEHWTGLKREVGVIRTLLDAGYEVYLPDYNQDPLEVPEEENEVLQYDIKSGVDIFAIKNGKIVLIDVTGSRQHQQKPVAIQPPKQIDIGFEWNPLLRRTLIDSHPAEVYRLVLGIPRQNDTFLPADFKKMPTHEALNKFGRLRYDQGQAIISILDSLKPKKVDYKLA